MDGISHGAIGLMQTEEELSKLFNLPIKRIRKMGEETAIIVGKNEKQVIKPIKKGPKILQK